MDFSPEKKHRIMNEVKCLAKLISNFVVRYYSSWTEDIHLYIHMEYCPQTLRSVLKEKQLVFGRQLPAEPMTIFEYFISCEILRELLQCLEFIHEFLPPIIHRDIKPENILISMNNTNIKLGDFGLATEHDRLSKSHTQNVGTVNYMAPEMGFLPTYGCKVDLLLSNV
ncbi:unnamed protein product [Medioppia subpectinata]|uniref:Protein kinase domain-containing protein n=1 Tax=Medioppia subpectinata TaxID=1979941 RepID=A0A7R9KB05_9ACAR|nr:unnamed protein product [Medioppia subpectinata]CAG2100075.1 unnamed protein product [Medioppia subpectinata]